MSLAAPKSLRIGLAVDAALVEGGDQLAGQQACVMLQDLGGRGVGLDLRTHLLERLHRAGPDAVSCAA